MPARDQFGHHDALVAGLVRQPGRTGQIADGIDALDPGAAVFVGDDMGAVDLDPRLLQAQPFGVADDANGRDHRVEIMRLGLAADLDMGRDDIALAVQLLDRGLFHDRHALLDELLPGECADLGILDGQDAVHDLDDGRLGAKRVEEAGEFDADGARSDDQQLFRHVRRDQRVLVVPDQLAVRLQPRQLARPRAGGQDDGFRGDLLGPLVGLDGHAAFAGQLGLPHDDRHLVLLEQVADAAGQLLGDAARPLHDRIQVIADAVGLQPEFFGAMHQVVHLGGPQHGLGRDAAPVQADAAQMLAFDTGHLEAQLRAPDRGHIAARPCADHHQVEILGHRVPR